MMMIMPVEFAIQRELAYRAKIANLLLSPSYDDAPLLEDLIPLEGQAPISDLKFNLPPPQLHEIENQTDSTSFKVQPTSANPSPSPCPRSCSSPSPIFSGTRRLSPANSIKFSPHLQLYEHGNPRDYTFYKVQSSSLTPNQREHSSSSPMLSGIKREPPANSLEFPSSPQPHEPGNQMGYTFCKVCQVPCQSFFNYRQHIRGRKHRGKLQELKFKDHLEDRKHEDEETKSKLDNKGGRGSEIAQPRYWCKLCNIWCTDKELLALHNEGKKHILKLHEIKKKRAMLGCEEMDGI